MEGDRTIDDLLKPPAAPVRDELATTLEPLLTDEWQKRADLARAVGRDPKDGSVGNALELLASRRIAEKGAKVLLILEAAREAGVAERLAKVE